MQHILKKIFFFFFGDSFDIWDSLVLNPLDESEAENDHSVVCLSSSLWQILKLCIITCIYYSLSSTIYVAFTEMLTHHRGLLCRSWVVSDFHLLYCIKIDKRVLKTSATLLSVNALGMFFHHCWDTPQCRR